MKLTKQKLFDLILEELSQQELDYFAGKDIPQFKTMATNSRTYQDFTAYLPDIDKKWIDNNIGEKLGSPGYSRAAFEFGDNKVIKFAYGAEMTDGQYSNIIEAKLFNQFPKIFPKAFAHDPDGKWVIIDRVDVITHPDKFYEALLIEFPVLKKVLQVLETGLEKPDEDLNIHFLWMLLSRALCHTLKNYTSNSPITYFLDYFETYFQISRDVATKAWETMTKDSNFMYWVGTLKNLRVKLGDIRAGNVGWSSDGRMVILDISILNQNDLYNARSMLKFGERDSDNAKVTPKDFGSKQILTPDGAKGDVYNPIQEQLMLEVLDSEPYPFKVYDGPNYPDDNSRMSVEYTFVSQKGEEGRKFRYTVKFYINKERLEVHVDFKANETWRMTNQLDMKALATIGAIVKDFAYNLRPTLNPPFNEATKFRAWTFGEFKGDARRMRIYKWMLQRGGAQMVQTDDDESSLSWEIPL